MSIQVAGGFGGSGGESFGLDISVVSQLPGAVQEGAVVLISSSYTAVYVDTDTPASPAAGDIWVQVGPSAHATEPAENTRLGLVSARQYSAEGEWSMIAGYVGADGEWSQFSALLPPTGQPLESYTWAQINEISSYGMADTYWDVGDTKTILIGGSQYALQIAGFNHDDLASSEGKAGITFTLLTCLSTQYSMNASGTNTGGWNACALRTTLQSDIYNQIEDDLRNIIKPVMKKRGIGGKQTTLAESQDTLFLFSENEIFGLNTYSAPGEGTQYELFTTAANRIKTVLGSAAGWWTGSAFILDSQAFCFVNNTGGQDATGAIGKYGIAFGCCV